MAHKLEDINLFNGNKMPIIGLGTAGASTNEVGKVLDMALEVGYRHFDITYVFGNEEKIGTVLRKWIDSQKLKREELFIVTKLPSVGNHTEFVEKFLKKSLENLQLDYVDLYLIHQTVNKFEGNYKSASNFTNSNNDELVNIWKVMEAQVDAGRAQSIGLSNFNQEQTKRIWNTARVKPASLQVELHAYFQQKELVSFCQSHKIAVVAYGPTGTLHYKNYGQSKQTPLTDPIVEEIAKKYRKTATQILLRHSMQRGVAVIPNGVPTELIKENFDVFDFELSFEDVNALNALDKGPKGQQFTGAAMLKRMSSQEFPFKIRY